MEEWRELARTVPATLILVAGGTTTRLLVDTLDSAHTRLSAYVDKAHSLRSGIAYVTHFGGPCAGEILEEAHRELVSLRELHASASHVFVLYGTRLGLHADPLWQRWEGHSADALTHSTQALQRLRAAISHVRAMRIALRMAELCPRRTPRWNAWMSTVLNLLRRAMWSEMMAALAVRRMRDAVTLEFFDAWMVLKNR